MKININQFLWLLFTVFLHFSCMPIFVYTYDNNTVHRTINVQAGKSSILGEYLKLGLGYSGGIEAEFVGDKAWQWLSDGGYEEDEPAPNVRFHFHDPFKEWDNAGIFEPMPLGMTGSALLRAQSPSYEYTWSEARESFYTALTTGSEQAFADTFLILGRLMHLVSDMAVPAHVRLDPHLTFATDWTNFIEDPDPYETWTAENHNSLNYTGIKVDPAFFNQALTTSEAPAPITALWDLDQYNGTNPGITLPSRPLPPTRVFPPPPPAVMKVGLAEYTNANFFSKDTIFKGYDHPSYWNTTPIGEGDWLNPETVLGEDGKPDNLVYAWGYAGGTGNIRLAGASFITRDSAKAGYVSPPMVIDDNVNKDYASRLIPAAVGYSTALLDYFFRGDIDSTKTKEMC